MGGAFKREKLHSQFTLVRLADGTGPLRSTDLAIEVETKWFELAWKDFGWVPVIEQVDQDGHGISNFVGRDSTQDNFEDMVVNGSSALFSS